MKFVLKCAALLTPVLALATPAFAYPPNLLADTTQPGSVIVFPKFINMPAVTTNGDHAVLPRTEIEIGAVCPPQVTAAGGACAAHQSITVNFHWVCPGIQSATTSNTCQERSFQVVVSVDGKLAFSADGLPINTNTPPVPAAPCPRGYLIGWVVNPNTNNSPIKFDGLIGNAVIRGPALGAGPDAGTSTAVSAYNAITIQADPALAATALGTPIAAPVDPLTGEYTLTFGVAGQYTTVPGTLFGDVKYDNTAVRAGPPTAAPGNALNRTYLILLTLDTRSNQPNFPTLVPLTFYNESLETVSATNPNFERFVDANREFLCWDQANLASDTDANGFCGNGTPCIDTNLTQNFMQTRKGIVIAGPATKVPELGVFDTAGPATLIGLVETIEGSDSTVNSQQERKYNFNLSTNGAPIITQYVPFPPF
jgi:hypothetical protein